MATIYVSYRSTESAFVEAVMSQLENRHGIRIDSKLAAGVDWRSQQLDELRTSDVFLVFVSKDTRQSDFQNYEMGSARFCSTFLDGKLIIPALIDDTEPPRPLAHLDALDLRHRDANRAAREIEEQIARRAPPVRLFISHAHKDADLASRLVDVLTAGLEVPAGELRCTSVPGYQLDLGTMAPDVLRRELGSAACVLAIITPNSLGNEWVLFELGAAWANAKVAVPLLAGGIQDRDIPGPFRGAAGGQLTRPATIDHMMDQLSQLLHWRQKADLASRNKRYELVEYVEAKTFARDALDEELKSSFAAKRARIGTKQGQLLDYITSHLGERPNLAQDELARHFANLEPGLYYRLEQLRLLGFLDRTMIASTSAGPVWGWTLSGRYRGEVGL
jgi:hypothetical protein